MVELQPTRTVRCAVYTRKSTEEGLEQEFNSLDAQREAAEAYIKSQRHLGLTLLPQHYDDGGFTGGNIDRPALQRLLEDIEARRVDCVLVYKVDRLSRSLLDFARLMDLFDQQKVSFVSVTQQFNTTNSLGRLTLNILLSFAQFEREIIGERTRDKMSAARRKGKWIGGIPILGYDVDALGGRLIVNDGEAARVREIFKLYAKHRSIPALIIELRRRRWSTKSWTPRHGRKRIGTQFNKPTLLRLLTNATYVGKVEHKGTIYPGEQTAIVDLNLWEAINSELRAAHRGPNHVPHTRQTGLLNGLLFCRNCDRPMVPTYTTKGDRRYRYYICQVARTKGWSACPTKSVPARAIEESVVTQLRATLTVDSARQQLGVSDAEWLTLDEGKPENLIRSVVERVTYDGISGAVSLDLDLKHT
jgi:site-specific DNA recombinase